MQNNKDMIFEKVKLPKKQVNSFDLSHEVKGSMKAGWLYPTVSIDCLPNDRPRIGCQMFVRMMPLVAPAMQQIDMITEYYFVPKRLCWPRISNVIVSGWEDYIVNKRDVSGNLPVHPYFRVLPTGLNYSPLLDAFGIPDPADNPTAAVTEKIDALPLIAYQMIYNEYYRWQDTEPEVDLTLNPTGDQTALTQFNTMRQRKYKRDYFTSSLTTPQLGAPVTVPVAMTDASINFFGTPDATLSNLSGVNPVVPQGTPNDPNSQIGPDEIYANMSGSENQSTINDFRTAWSIQALMESLKRIGQRFVEYVRRFGVKPQDGRFDRPEYITGVTQPFQITEVTQTSETASTPQGNMAGHGITAINANDKSFYCPEHGFIIGITSIRPKAAYFQGLERQWTKINNPYEHFVPELAHLGEQAVLNREIYAYDSLSSLPWGYLPFWTEYRMKQDRVFGQMRSTLNFWHLARIFASMPALTTLFQSVLDADNKRIFAVTDPNEDSYIITIYHRITNTTAVPVFGVPATL